MMVKEIAKNIFKIENQYFYGEHVGIYLLILEGLVLLFDLPKYSDELAKYLEGLINGKKFIAILSHGPCGIADGKVWQQKLGLKVYLHKEDIGNEWLMIDPDVLFSDPPTIHKDTEIIYTPGHSRGSICLLHKPSKILFTGDSIYNKNEVLSLDNDIALRKRGLEKLIDYDFEQIYPFHYDPLLKNAKSKLKEFIYNQNPPIFGVFDQLRLVFNDEKLLEACYRLCEKYLA